MSENEFRGLPNLDRALIVKILDLIGLLPSEDIDLTDFNVPCGAITASSLAGIPTAKLVQLLHRLYIEAEDFAAEAGASPRFPTDLASYARGDGRRPQYTSRFSHQDIADRSG